MKFLVLLLAAVLSAVCSPLAHAKDVTLAWDANTEPDIAGYKIYYNPDTSELPFVGSDSSQGASPVDVGNVTTVTLTGLDPTKTHYFAVTAYDTSGYESSFSNIVSAAEAVPPTVSIASPGASATLSGTVTITVDATDNTAVDKVEIFVDDVSVGILSAAPYAAVIDTLKLANGAHTIKAVATDTVGNSGEATGSYTVFNDTSAPTVTVVAPVGGTNAAGRVTLSAQASDNVGVTKLELYVDGGLVSTADSGSLSFSWDSRTMANGNVTLTAKAYDAAGNSQVSQAVTIAVLNDKTPPDAAIVSPAPDAAVKGAVTISASATDNVGVAKAELYIDGILKATRTVAPYVFTWQSTTVADGPHTIRIEAYDAEGTTGSSPTVTVNVGNKPPVVAITSPQGGWKFKKTQLPGVAPAGVTVLVGQYDVPVSVEASAGAGISKVVLYANGKVVDTKTAAPFNFTWNTAAENGTRALVAKAYDTFGRVAASKKIPVLVSADVLPPRLKISAPLPTRPVTGIATVKVSAKDPSGISQVDLYVNDVLIGSKTKSAYTFKWDTTGYSAAADHVLKAVAWDRLGNRAEYVSMAKVKDVVPPVLTVAPLSVEGAFVALSATAADNVAVTEMRIIIDGVTVATSPGGAVAYAWDTTAARAGSHTVTVVAYDAAGKSGREAITWVK